VSHDDDLKDTAWLVLMAAVLLRDMAYAMPPRQFVAMPEDIRNRMTATYYQDTFDRLPEDIRRQAQQRLLADPDVQAARNLDAAARGEAAPKADT
jgi:hypothetical protein